MNPITVKPIGPIARGSLRVQSDARLAKLFRRGVDPAFDELVRRYRDVLVNYAGAIVGHDRAEDVVQEALVKAHRSLAGEQTIEPKPWLYTVVRNQALNDIRDNRKHRHADLGESASRTSQTHDIVEQREHFAAVLAAVSDLPEAQRRALVDHELGGFTHEEIAAGLDLSTGATKQLIYRARLTLRNAAGAMIPVPLIAWLAADTTGVFTTGAATGVAAGGAWTAASGGGTAGVAASGGLLTGIAGAGGTKLAIVAVVAGGSIAAGVSVERHNEQSKAGATDVPAKVQAASSSTDDMTTETTAVVAGDIGTASISGAKAKAGSDAKEDSSGSDRPENDDSGSGSGGSTSPRPESGGGHQGSKPVRPTEDSSFDSSGHGGGSHSGSGGDRPAGGYRPSSDSSGEGSGGGGDTGEEYEPSYPPGSGSGTGSGSGGGSGSGSGSGSGHGDSGYVPPVTPKPEGGSGGSGSGPEIED